MNTVSSRVIIVAATLGCVMAFAGCGLKGPLTLPDKATNAATRAPAHKRGDDESTDPNKTPASTSTPDPGAAPANDNSSVTPAGQVSGSAPPAPPGR